MVGSADQAPVGVMGFFQRAATGGQDRADAFALGDRGSILHHLDQPAIIPHVAESENKKFTFEVRTDLNRSCRVQWGRMSMPTMCVLVCHRSRTYVFSATSVHPPIPVVNS